MSRPPPSTPDGWEESAARPALSAGALAADPGGFSRADFRELFEGHRDALFRFLVHLTRNRADAEDLLQEAFLTVWRKRHQYEGRGSAVGYLRQTAFRLYLNRREKEKRRKRLAPPPQPERTMPDTGGEVARAEALRYLMEKVKEALRELPDGPREAFVLFRFEGLTCREISEATGVPVKTVETRLRRGTQLLAQKLRKHRRHLPTD